MTDLSVQGRVVFLGKIEEDGKKVSNYINEQGQFIIHRGTVMVNAIFSGSISAQDNPNQTVSIVVTKPDATKETLSALTTAGLTFSVSKQYMAAGTYTAQAHLNADSIYSSWDSGIVGYNVSLTSRSGTLIVTLN